LALELAQKAAGFRRSLPECLLTSLASLVRAMNGYYSNLIESHDTHPVDIERALKNDYSKDSRKRDLQLRTQAESLWLGMGSLHGLDVDMRLRARNFESVRMGSRRGIGSPVPSKQKPLTRFLREPSHIMCKTRNGRWPSTAVTFPSMGSVRVIHSGVRR
jgi:hypothetical protein